jgi:CoA:oxalate CoA-transferase
MSFPCDDLVVLDFSQVLAGPYVGRILAEFGADVIKVESPRGDPTRVIAPRWDRGQSGLYTWANLGKRNVCIDLGREEGRALVHDLIRRAHVVIENFRPGVAERLGIGWPTVHELSSRCVMLSISGFGADSSRSKRGAFAPTIHAATGVLDYAARKARQPARPTGDAGADITTSLQAAIALFAALRAAERSGEGEHVELAMYEAVLASHSETPFVLVEPPEDRYDTDPFDAGANRQIAVAGPPQHVWVQMRDQLGLEDPATADAPLEEKALLRRASIERWMAAQPDSATLIDALEEIGLASATVETLEEAVTGAYARERNLLRDVDDRKGGTRPVTRLPYRFSRSRVEPRLPAPTLGEHNAEVLREHLALPDSRIRELEATAILATSGDVPS